MWGIIALLIIGGIWYFAAAPAEAPVENNEQLLAESINTDPPLPPVEIESTAKEFAVVAANFKFSEKEMRVRKGDTVKITLANNEGTHDLKIDEFDVATAKLDAGKQETVEFVANKAGTFEYYCSIGTHRQMGMKGNLIIE